MGFTFRHDLLFGMDNPYDHLFVPSWAPHPVVSQMPPMDFAIACSIDPGTSWGWPIIEAASLWSMPAYYRSENFFPVPQHTPAIRYGAFIELWGTTYGKGRVLAFGDSTIFSNFSTFEPGKAELMRDMLVWLNHTSPLDVRTFSLLLRVSLLLLAAVALVVGCAVARADAVHGSRWWRQSRPAGSSAAWPWRQHTDSRSQNLQTFARSHTL